MPQLIAVQNGLIALSFFAIAAMIFAGLLRDRALGLNPLGIATGFIFFTCATGHAVHAEHYIVEPAVYSGDTDLWHLALVDGFTLAAGIGYLAQRRRYGIVIRGTHPMLDYQERLQMSEALRDIGQDIAAQTDISGLLRRVVVHARGLLKADYAAIVVLDQPGRVRRQISGIAVDRGNDKEWQEAVFLSDSGAGPNNLVSTQHPVVMQDLLSVANVGWSERTLHRLEGGRSVLAVPICRGSEVVGSLMVAYRSVRPLTANDLSGASALASQAAVAMGKASLIDSLTQADRLKDEFLSAAAHELKTPVTAIKGWSEILLSERRERVDERKALETIHRGAERIARLSEDLLAVMQLRPASTAINRTWLDVSQLVRDSVEAEQGGERHNVFAVSTNGPLHVEGERKLLENVVRRLLENAITYSPADKPIEVKASTEGKSAVVSVTHFGMMVPPDRQPHIFEPFYEPIPPGTEGYVSTVSLGLYLSKQIVEAHGGRIWFGSGSGGGSTFCFSLPLAKPQ